ncbi:GNAT family N-acetyltransferase [Candidatus Hepatobacter penaei]|uniref:GNAT family N-acetyltransferase n=1 Tax=Candidatus Hepatobacter penaei TaxID=1274402 RepID=UPI00155AD750|nr:GNAT family N-acetyltransferase [Candidatus Hepatobacter penaei]
MTCFSDDQTMRFYQDGTPWEADYLTKRMANWVNRWDRSPFSWWTLLLKKKEQDGSELGNAQPSESVPIQQDMCIIGAIGSFFTRGNPEAKNPALKEPFVELAYLLHHDYHQQKYMSEALNVILRHIAHEASQMDPACALMGAPVRPDNKASIRLLKKVGFHEEAEPCASDDVAEEGQNEPPEAALRVHFRKTCEPKAW